MSHNHHTRNTCPECNDTFTCRCMATKVETTNICSTCKDKMKLKEDAVAGATGAGAIAGNRGRMFMGVRKIPKVPGKIPVIDYKKSGVYEGQKSFSAFLKEADDAAFDSVDVISKLARNADVADELDGDDMAVFGMEDEDGAITKVYVPRDQSKEFEAALADSLKDAKEVGEQEIAGILYDLKDRFKIIDVKWPTVQEDEEQAPAAVGTPGAPVGAGDPAIPGSTPADPNAPAADPNAPADPNAALGADPLADPNAAPAEPPVDQNAVITQILDMLRADAEARKAEADAKTAAARADEAEAAGKVAAIKLQGEEGVLDAEAYFKDKKDEKKEADRIKMLAKFRQETQMADDTAIPVPTGSPSDVVDGEPAKKDEDEEFSSIRKQLLSILGKV